MKDIKDVIRNMLCRLSLHAWIGDGNPTWHGMGFSGYLKRKCKYCGKCSDKPIIT